jgi:hypothetical protein
MNLNHFYHYYKSKSGGVSNLLKATEDFDSSIDWNKLPSTDAPTVSGGITDPNGGSDAQRINFTDNRQARVQQRVSLSASTQYTFSVYARVNTGTQQFRLRNVTLGEAEAKTATTSWTRFEYTFTTTTGGNYDLSIQNSSNDARTVEFWGAMLNVGASANDYVKVDPSISGSTPTPAYSGFGDTYGDVTAYYSLRKFTEAETLNAIRVRRSSDDTEQDIGFDANGDLDTTALLAFVGTGGTDNGYVTTFYDQSGNGNNATNATSTEQPLIVSGGSVVTENGKAALEFDGVNDELVNSSITLTQPFTYFHARKYRNTTSPRMALSLSTSTNSWADYFDGSSLRAYFGSTGAKSEGFNTDQNLWGAVVNGTSSEVLLNGTSTAANLGTNNGDAVVIGDRGNISGINAAVNVQEIIIFDSDQSGNRTNMETNINDHFDIYTP